MAAPLSACGVPPCPCPRAQLQRCRSRRQGAPCAAASPPQPQPPPNPAAAAHAGGRAALQSGARLAQPGEPALARRGALAALLLPLAAGPARAEDAVETVEISMGEGEQGSLVFVPNRVTLRRNKAYRLVLSNPSTMYHNFVATEFLLHGAYWLLTKIGEAGATEWYVVPRKLGLYEFKCTVVGHDNMKGIIEVVP